MSRSLFRKAEKFSVYFQTGLPKIYAVLETPAVLASGTQPVREHSFASLNLMRGLSAFAVLFSHTAAIVSEDHPLVQFNWGSLAVDVFMLISGFLMMWHFYERRQRGEAWGSASTCLKFYTRRFFRIAPLYYCLLVVVFCLHSNLRGWEQQNGSLLHQTLVQNPHYPTSVGLTWAYVVAHFSFLFGFIPSFVMGSFLPDWSIGLEMQFYLFFPFLALLLERSEFIGGVVALLGINWLAVHCFNVGIAAVPGPLGLFPFPTFWPLKINIFLVGMLVAAGLFEKKRPARRMLLLLLGLLVAGLYMKKFLLITFIFAGYELAFAGGTGLALIENCGKRIESLLQHRLCGFAADTSYGVYLIHAPVLILMVHLLTTLTPFAAWPGIQRFLICLVLIIPLAYSLAFLTFKYVETPGIALGRKLIKRIR